MKQWRRVGLLVMRLPCFLLYAVCILCNQLGFSESHTVSREEISELFENLTDIDGPPILLNRIRESKETAKSSVKGLWHLAFFYHVNGHRVQAIAVYEYLLRHDLSQIERAKIQFYLADLAIAAGDLKGAKQSLERSVMGYAKYSASLNRLGDAYFKLNEESNSLVAYQAALEVDGNDRAALLGLARIYFDKGKDELAISLLEHLLASAPGEIKGSALLMQALERRGENKRAIEVRRAVRSKPSPPLVDPWMMELDPFLYDSFKLNYLFEDYKNAGDYERALAYLQRILALDRDSSAPYLNLANLYVLMEDLPKAIESLRSGIALEGKVESFYPPLIRNLRDEKRIDEALVAADEGLAIRESSPSILFEKALTYFQLGERNAALETLYKLRDIDPYHVEGRLLIVRIGMEANKREDVKPDLKMLDRMVMSDFDSLMRLALMHMGSGFYGEAVSYVEKALIVQPMEREAVGLLIEAHQRIGEVKISQNDLTGALPSFEKILGLDPKNRKALYYSAMINVETESFDKAEKALKNMIDEFGRDPAILLTYGDVLSKNGKEFLAQSVWQEVADSLLGVEEASSLRFEAMQRLGGLH